MSTIKRLISDFTTRIVAVFETEVVDRVRQSVSAVLGGRISRKGRGRPAAALQVIGKKPRRKGPKQLCPVPGCKNPAAPVFGMVCAKHKDVAKAKIKKYRAARRTKQLKAKAAALIVRRSGGRFRYAA
jgi:hypothetical protein